MKFIKWILLAWVIHLCSCEDQSTTETDISQNSSVLVLLVDYNTTTFQGGKELLFPEQTEGFSIQYEQDTLVPAYVKLRYTELNELLFYVVTFVATTDSGIVYPGRFLPASSFAISGLEEIDYPENGFYDIYNPENEAYDYDTLWNAVKDVELVQNYLSKNPTQRIQLFLFKTTDTPDNRFWKWVLFLKK